MESVNDVMSENISLGGNINSREIVPFPIDNIDTLWMTKSQKRIFKVIIDANVQTNNYKDIVKIAGFKNIASWYYATADKRFSELIESLGVNVRSNDTYAVTHGNVKLIQDPHERDDYLKRDKWDCRRLFSEYPRHKSPSHFIVDFGIIKNANLRPIVKRYFKNMLASWKPITYKTYLYKMVPFFNSIDSCYPSLISFKQLSRSDNIERIIQNMNCSKYTKWACLNLIRQMFKYMYDNNWADGPNTDALIISYDIPSRENTLPRPIPPNIKTQFDIYIVEVIVPILEKNEITPIVDPQYWDMLIVLRFTGRRYEDVSHLVSDNSDVNCLRYDYEGDPQLYIDHRIAKIPKDLVIPLAHLNKDTPYGNIVERAILRQQERVKYLSAAPDGYKYLFREVKYSNKRKPFINELGNQIIEVVSYSKINDNILASKVCPNIPLLNIDGSVYSITPHQFRHTVATEMIDAGIDIFAVKEFLGHSSIVMTEKYIKVYQQRLKKEFKEKLSKSDATFIKNDLIEREEIYDNKWVKNKIIGIFELGDGCCEHPYKMPSCPHMACKTCVKKKIYPRHLQAVKDTIVSETIHRDNAIEFGLTDKAEEFDKVVKFYTIALEIINKGEPFEASKHFYVRGMQ